MPSASEFDADGYRRDVLDCARKRENTPPPDLLERYAIAVEMEHDPAAFEARVAEVVKYWRSIGQQKLYRRLADALLAADKELKAADKITFAHFAQRRRDEGKRAQARLESLVTDIAATSTAVLRSTLTWIYDEGQGLLSEETIRLAFAARQVAVVDEEWTLPRRPPAPYSDLAGHLSTLGFSLAAEVVFGTDAVRSGFRLRNGFELVSGDRVTVDLLDQKVKALAQRPHDERKTALSSVLAMLQRAAGRPGELNALLMWQLIDVLQPQLTAGLPNRSVANSGAELGLDRAEAAELVLALTRRRSEATGARVAALVQEADAAQRAGATEEAAGFLTAALAMTSDGNDHLRARLHSLPPPPPVRVTASEKDGSVRLEWTPGPARTAGIRYRVVRQIGAPGRRAIGRSATGRDHGPVRHRRRADLRRDALLHRLRYQGSGRLVRRDVGRPGSSAAGSIRMRAGSPGRLGARLLEGRSGHGGRPGHPGRRLLRARGGGHAADTGVAGGLPRHPGAARDSVLLPDPRRVRQRHRRAPGHPGDREVGRPRGAAGGGPRDEGRTAARRGA